MKKRYPGVPNKDGVRLDYLLPDWDQKNKAGKESWECDNERMEYLADFLAQLPQYCPQRRLEVVIVTHSSVLKELFRGNQPSNSRFPRRLTYIFWEKRFTPIDNEALSIWRRAVDLDPSTKNSISALDEYQERKAMDHLDYVFHKFASPPRSWFRPGRGVRTLLSGQFLLRNDAKQDKAVQCKTDEDTASHLLQNQAGVALQDIIKVDDKGAKLAVPNQAGNAGDEDELIRTTKVEYEPNLVVTHSGTQNVIASEKIVDLMDVDGPAVVESREQVVTASEIRNKFEGKAFIADNLEDLKKILTDGIKFEDGKRVMVFTKNGNCIVIPIM